MWYQSHEDKIRRLENDLHRTRRAIIHLLPPTVQEVAKDYYRIETRVDAAAWLEKIVELTTEIAWPYAQEEPYSGPRASCPLCKRGTRSYMGEEGFLLPGGLRKHLLGEGNAHECDILAPVRELAEGHWRPRVEEAEARERSAKEAAKERRRQTEEQFRVEPSGTPKLRDELYGSEARDDESLAWAINRLSQLGFVETRDGIVRQFTKDCGSVIIFADPRERGRINFDVYRREQVEKPKSRRRRTPHHSSFHLLDSWRNELPGNSSSGCRTHSARWAEGRGELTNG